MEVPDAPRGMVDCPGPNLYKQTYHQEKASSHRPENILQSQESIYET